MCRDKDSVKLDRVHALLGDLELLIEDLVGAVEVKEYLVFLRPLGSQTQLPVVVVGRKGEVLFLAINDEFRETVIIVGDKIEAGVELPVALKDELALAVVDGGVADEPILGEVVAHIKDRIGIVLGDEGNLVVAFGGKSDCRQEEGKKDCPLKKFASHFSLVLGFLQL